MKKKKADCITTLIGPGTTVEGVIAFTGTIRVDGNVKGKIESRDGIVIIGEKAIVEGDLFVDVAKIMGQVNGAIDAGSRIEILPPGCVIGDIQAPIVSIDAGVKFNGNCVMKGRKGTEDKTLGRSDTNNLNVQSKIKNFPKNL